MILVRSGGRILKGGQLGGVDCGSSGKVMADVLLRRWANSLAGSACCSLAGLPVEAASEECWEGECSGQRVPPSPTVQGFKVSNPHRPLVCSQTPGGALVGSRCVTGAGGAIGRFGAYVPFM